MAKIVHIPQPVQLTDEDLEITESACRRLARRYRRSAQRQLLTAFRDSCLRSAAHFEAIAERIKRARRAYVGRTPSSST